VVFAFIAIIPSFVLCVMICGDYAGCGFLNLLERGSLPINEIIPGPPISYCFVFLSVVSFFLRILSFCFGLACFSGVYFQLMRSPQICHNRLPTLAIFFYYFPFLIGIKRFNIGIPARFAPFYIIHRGRPNFLVMGCPLNLPNQSIDSQLYLF
jgi:hypothetical protein